MPFEITWEPNGIYKKFRGQVTATEFMKAIAALHGDSRFDSCRYSINDFLAVEGHNISELDVKKYAGFAIGAASTNPNIKVAVVTTDEQIIGLVNFYSAPGRSPFPLKVFASLAEAKEWAT